MDIRLFDLVQRRQLVAVAVAILAATLTMLLLPHGGNTAGWVVPVSPSLPRPTGAYEVGVRDVHLVDRGQGPPRELMLQAFYPSARAGGAALETYARNTYVTEQVAMRWGTATARRLGLRKDAVNWQFRTWSRIYTPIRQGRHPVVVFSPPRSEMRTSYTLMAEELASHGFLVIAVDHTGDAPVVEFPGRRIVESGGGIDQVTKARDLRLVIGSLDRLGPQLAAAADPSRVGVFGDLGVGSEGFATLLADGRIGALAALPQPQPTPPGPKATSDTPTLFLGPQDAPDDDAVNAAWPTLRGWKARIVVDGSTPRSFTDAAHYLPAIARAWKGNAARPPTPPTGVPAALAASVSGHAGTAAPTTVTQATRSSLTGFFGEHLKGGAHGSGGSGLCGRQAPAGVTVSCSKSWRP